MADNAIFGIVLGILCALPILTLATRNIIIGFFATFSMCCTTVCVIGMIPLAGWKLGVRKGYTFMFSICTISSLK